MTINSIDQKATIFGRTIGLAGALAYLHEGLDLSSTNKKLHCYHLDLKPQNILIFEADGNDIWKISDFGISRIKSVPRDRPHGQYDSVSEHLLDKIFNPKKDVDLSSGVKNARFGGTYAAPEAREEHDMVTRNSDVWSLGCVLVLVLTFLESQSRGIHQFQQVREKNRKHDWFFDSKALKTNSRERHILHSSVSKWLKMLTKQASKRGISEGRAIQRTSEMLQDKVLIRDPNERFSANKVESELRDIQSCFTEEDSNLQEMDGPPQSTHKLGFPRLHLPRSNQKHTAKPWYDWPFEIPKAAKRCEFSPDGAYVAIESDTMIAIKSTADIQSGRPSINQEPQNNGSCADFSLGSKYMCAALDSDYFEVLLEWPKMSMQSMLTECSAILDPCQVQKAQT